MRIMIAVLAFLLAVSPAAAQSLCDAHGKVLDYFAKQYKEQPAVMGITGSGSVMEILVSETGTWTIIVTSSEGQSCLVGVGKAWELIKRPKGVAM